jgi:hypothetical protein
MQSEAPKYNFSNCIKFDAYIETETSRYNLRHLYLDSVVGIATGYGLDDRGVGVRVLVE